MSIYQLPDAELITLGNHVLESADETAIAQAMTVVGYNESALQQGRSLLEAFSRDSRLRVNKYGDQISATETLSDAWDAFHSETYMPHVTIARLIFRPDGAYERLELGGDRADDFDDYVDQAHVFYDTIAEDPELQEALAARGITAEHIAAARVDLVQLEQLNRVQENEKIDARQATRHRNDARRAFVRWLSQYQQFAKVALVDHPDLLEKVGVRVRAN